MDSDLMAQAQALLDVCRKRKLTIATAESCTGGLLAATLTTFRALPMYSTVVS